MTRLRSLSAALAAAAALGAGSAGATTIISGSNSVFVHQSPGGTTILAQPSTVSHSLRPMRRPDLGFNPHRHAPDTHAQAPFSLGRMFFFFLPWTSAPRVHVVPPYAPNVAPATRARSMFHESAGENRASAMMDTILRRMDR